MTNAKLLYQAFKFLSWFTGKLVFEIMNLLEEKRLSPMLLKEKERLSVTTS